MAVNQPPEVEFPANPENYSVGREGTNIDMIVLHKEQGTHAQDWFAAHQDDDENKRVSAHCAIEHDGTIYRCIDDGDTAWHAGKWDVNLRSLGVEHAGYAEQNDVTPEQYEASAQLVAYWAQTYGIPLRHVGGGTQGSWTGEPGIIYHYEVPHPNNHYCPGHTLDMQHIIARAQEIIGGGQTGGHTRGPDDIIGAAIYPVERLLEFAQAKGATTYALELIPAIYKYAPQRNLGADFLCVQMFLETGFGTYQGVSQPYNPAGIKTADATGDTPADFEVPPNADEGARMQVNHWIAVLQLPDEPIGIPHGRYYVARKVYAAKPLIRHISQLGNGNWAADPQYAVKLRHLLDELAVT